MMCIVEKVLKVDEWTFWYNIVMIKNEADISRLVESDQWMMDVLRAAEKMDLPDWWIGGGFLRNKVWNAIEGNELSSDTDVDLSYFDAKNVIPETDWSYDEQAALEYPFAQWQIRNQARMHYVNDLDPFESTVDAAAHWPETASCIAVKLQNGELKFLFCYGTDDLLNLIARPNPNFKTRKLLGVFNDRVEKKQWRKVWPNLRVEI